ncbi:hypothetical protein JKP88DRAFT_321120 [Tribonema minus]|uniref:Uncharacterized protein n=1 Tax=Tribonema minus TaxID=303371 RepID=A0A836CDB0_9STRA|nr:hypothetical protein JKP88DRAFT_321120 [Tribonema minus]
MASSRVRGSAGAGEARSVTQRRMHGNKKAAAALKHNGAALNHPDVIRHILRYAGKQQHLFFGGVSKLWRQCSASHDPTTAHAQAAKYPSRLLWVWTFHRTVPLCRAIGRWANAESMRQTLRCMKRLPEGVEAVVEGAVTGDRVDALMALQTSAPRLHSCYAHELTLCAAAQGSLRVASWAAEQVSEDHYWDHEGCAMAAIQTSNLRLWRWHSVRMRVCKFDFKEAIAIAVLMEDVAVLREVSAAIPDCYDLGGEESAADCALGIVENYPFLVMEMVDTCLFAHKHWPEIFTAEDIAQIAIYSASLALATHPLIETPYLHLTLSLCSAALWTRRTMRSLNGYCNTGAAGAGEARSAIQRRMHGNKKAAAALEPNGAALNHPDVVRHILRYAGKQQHLLFGGVSKLWRQCSASHNMTTAHAQAAKYPSRLSWVWAFYRTVPLCRAIGRWATLECLQQTLRCMESLHGGVQAITEGAIAGDRVDVLAALRTSAPCSTLSIWRDLHELTLCAVEQGSLRVASWAAEQVSEDHYWDHEGCAMAATQTSNLHLWWWHFTRMDVCQFEFQYAVASAAIMEDMAVLRAVSASIPVGYDLSWDESAAECALQIIENNPYYVINTVETCVFAHTQWPEIFTAQVVARIPIRSTSLALATHPLFEDAIFAVEVGAVFQHAMSSEDHAFFEWLLRHERVSMHRASEHAQTLVRALQSLREKEHPTVLLVDAAVAVVVRCHPSLAPLLQ